jgi:hypothetical protein
MVTWMRRSQQREGWRRDGGREEREARRSEEKVEEAEEK